MYVGVGILSSDVDGCPEDVAKENAKANSLNILDSLSFLET